MPLVLTFPHRTSRHQKANNFFVIGERINPSGRRKIAVAFENSDWDVIAAEAESQLSAGAHALDLNVGGNPDSAGLMRRAVKALEQRGIGPWVVDSIFPQVLEAGLLEAQERVLVNSVKGNESSLEFLLPVIAKRRVPFIGLVIDESGIPASWQARVKIAQKIVARASGYGIPKEDIVIDCAALPLKFYPEAVFETLEAVKAVRENLGVWTCLGVSNVSYGLTRRAEVNAAFLRLARVCGLDAGILNPLDERVMKAVQPAGGGLSLLKEVEKFKESYADNG